MTTQPTLRVRAIATLAMLIAFPALERAGHVRQPAAVYQPTLDRIVVFVRGDDGHLYDKYWDGSAWVWQDQGMPQ